MSASALFDRAAAQFRAHFGRDHAVAAYAPGRVEILGNHTDYNEGLVLSAAINFGTYFLAAPAPSRLCRLLAGDTRQEVVFPVAAPAPARDSLWANYVKGVLAGLERHAGVTPQQGFLGMLLGDVPLGAGLSSSAALEISSGLALAALYGLDVPPLDLARIGQKSEHEFVGVKCGLLDQISSLFAQPDRLVASDFRSLRVETVPLGESVRFLMCNTKAKHALVDGEYNERRHCCEAAARYFAGVLPHPVTALRDVSWDEWREHAGLMDPKAARRAAHVIGENGRVTKGIAMLRTGQVAEFGKLMFESHASSISNFENSCPELDLLVSVARRTPGVLGARLSGGGFGGSAVALVEREAVDAATESLVVAYRRKFGHPCDVREIVASGGARRVEPAA
jgi:galactokinase